MSQPEGSDKTPAISETKEAPIGKKSELPKEKTETPQEKAITVEKEKTATEAVVTEENKLEEKKKTAEDLHPLERSEWELPNEEKFDPADYGGSQYGGSTHIIPEPDGFW